MKRRTALILASLVLIAPIIASAAGLVPCGGPSEPACQLCYGAELLNNIATWLIMVLSAVIAIVFAVAGLRLVSSTGNVAEKESAKRMVTNAFIGYLIVLGAWLFLDFGMRVLLGGGFVSTYGPWNAISCVDQPESYTDSSGLVFGASIDQTCADLACTVESAACTAGGGTPTVVSGSLNCAYSATAYSGSCSPITDTSNPCHETNLVPYFGARAAEASVICNKESGGAPVNSGSDLCCGPSGNCSGAPSFSGGYFQVNILAHGDMVPGCSPGSFFTPNGNNTIQGDCVRRNSGGVCTGWSCSITDTAMYNTCMQGARDSATNFSIAQDLFNSRGFQPWSWSSRICGVSF